MQIRAKCNKSGIVVNPVEVQRGEYEAVKAFRRHGRPSQETYPAPLLNAVFKLLAVMATGKQGLGSTGSEVSSSSNEHAGAPTFDEMLAMFSSGKWEGDADDGVNVNDVFQF
jgi:hypothetical protein